jgi:tRNA(fMet)-specific endonuclease VapC
MATMARRDAVIDASIIIQHARARTKPNSYFLRSLLVYDPHLSAITVYEIELGAYRANRLSDITSLQVDFKILPLTEEIARHAASLDANLIRQNLQIGVKDTFIAATSLVHGLPLLSVNTRHFERIEGLELIDLNTLPFMPE